MANIALTKTQMLDQDTIIDVTAVPATSSVINTAESFAFTLKGAGYQSILLVTVASGHGDVAYSIAPGTMFGSNVAAETGSFTADKTQARVIDSSRFKDNDGEIVITFTPATGKRLLTDHALSCELIEMPF